MPICSRNWTMRPAMPSGPGTVVEDFNQKIAGVAVVYEIRHLVIVGEWTRNRWRSPFIAAAAGGAEDLEVTGGYLEARYKLALGLSAAGRYSTLRFGEIDDGTGQGRRIGWDYDTLRLEAGVGYWITEGVFVSGRVREAEPLVRQRRRSARGGAPAEINQG